MTQTGGRIIRGLDAEQRREQRRDQLLDAALDLFAANGYLNTSIEQICATAYVSTKSFYEAFGSREDCYLALMRRSSERIFERVGRAYTDTAGLPETLAAERLIATLAGGLIDDPRVATVLFGEGVAVSQATEHQRRTNRRQAAAFIEEVWKRYGRGNGGNHAIAVGLIGGLFDIIADWLVDADTTDPDARDRLITNLNHFYATVIAGL